MSEQTEQVQAEARGPRLVTRPRTVGEVVGWSLAAASVASAAIHFSVIGEHFHEAWYFGTFFAIVAWLQLAWAVGVVTRPSRRTLLAGAVLQSAIVVVYLWSRTTGLPIGPEPWQPEAWGFLDLLSTALEVLAAAGAFLLAYRPLDQPLDRRVVSAALGGMALAVVATTSIALAVTSPEMAGMDALAAANHATAMGDMGSGSGAASSGGSIGMAGMSEKSGSTSTSTGAMQMGTTGSTAGTSGMASMTGMTAGGAATTTSMAGMQMGDGSGATTTMPGMGDGSFELATNSPAGAVMWPMMNMTMEQGMQMAGPPCTTTPSTAQRQAAVTFVNQTVAATAKYRSLSAAIADGFVPITPPGSSVVHYINWENMAKDQTPSEVLNPAAVQSLVYANTSTGPRLVAAMYLMPNGSTATPPQPGGCLEQWHLHTNLCFNSSNNVVGVTNSQGQCPAGAVNRVTQPMIHVWLAPIDGGPLMVDASNADVVAAASRLPVADAPPEHA
jgi:hypothetical protein